MSLLNFKMLFFMGPDVLTVMHKLEPVYVVLHVFLMSALENSQYVSKGGMSSAIKGQ